MVETEQMLLRQSCARVVPELCQSCARVVSELWPSSQGSRSEINLGMLIIDYITQYFKCFPLMEQTSDPDKLARTPERFVIRPFSMDHMNNRPDVSHTGRYVRPRKMKIATRD